MFTTFREYVAALGSPGDSVVLTNRSFLKIERLTGLDLRARTYQCAHYLRGLGVERGDRVVVMAPNSPEWVELMLATVLLGAVLVPVDVQSTADALARVLDDTQPKIAFCGKFVVADLTSTMTRVLDELPTYIAGSPSDEPSSELDGDLPAFIVFTSGTTADPKGVVLSHLNVLSNIEGILERIDVQSEWRFLSVLPLSHTYEMTATLALLSKGASVTYLARVTPQAISEALVDYEITAMLAIPQLLLLMADRVKQGAQEEGQARRLAVGLSLAAHLPFPLRRILFRQVHSRLGGHFSLFITGGAPIPLDVATNWELMGVRTLQGYGLTETSPILTCNPLGGERLDSPGRALANVQLRVGDDGEIQAQGPSVFAQYWRNTEATRDAFTADGWFRTGDVGRLEDGWLHIEGRLKFAIVRSSGLKVFPEDIEEVAESDPRLYELCVVGVPSATSESVVAVVHTELADEVIERAIHDLNSKLASFQHVDEWRRWTEPDFPRTRLLKIDRRRVQVWAGAGAPRANATPVAPSKSDDPVLLTIRRALDDASVTPRDEDLLGDLGLDSLRRLNVVSLLEEQLGVSIADDAVGASTSVGELRALTKGGGGAVLAEAPPPRWPYWPATRFVGNAVRDYVLSPIVRFWARDELDGAEALGGLSTPALFIFNHSDDFDGPVLYHALPRSIRRRLAVATGADVLDDHKVLAFVVRFCFAGFAFARSEPYLPSLKYVGSMIDRGWNVLLSPEGHISTNGELQPFKSGVGLLAVNLGVPVVLLKTIGLTGTVPLHAKWPKKRGRVKVRVGGPLCFGPSQDYEEATATLHRLMEAL